MYKEKHKLQDMERHCLSTSSTVQGLSHVQIWQQREYGKTDWHSGKHDLWAKTETVFAFKSNTDKTHSVQYQSSVAGKVVAKGKE